MRLIRWLLFGLALNVTACTNMQGDKRELPLELVDAAVVSIVQPGFQLPAGARIAWGENMRLLADSADKNLVELVRAIQGMIDDGLIQRDFQLVAADQQYAYELFAAVVVGHPEGEQALVKMLNLNTLAASWAGQGSATLGMALRRPGSARNLWSCAIQLPVDDASSMAERERRGQAAVTVLLQRLPLQ